MLQEDIQVKEAEALKQTLSMIVDKMPQQVKGKCLKCKVDTLVLKAVLERQGISVEYIPSEENKAE